MKKTTWIVVGLTILLAASVAARQDAPAPQTTFKTGVEIIQLDISVLDTDRHPVRGLLAGDFTVLVDGVRRPVVAFKAVELPPPLPPSSAPWIRDVAPDISTNTRPSGRVVVIMIDDGSFYQVDPPTVGSAGGSTAVADVRAIQKTRAAARRVVDELGPDDMAAVVFSENNHSAQSFTRDRPRLLAAIDDAALFPGPSAVDSDDPYGLKRGACGCGNCSVTALAKIAESLRSLPQQRKIMVYVSPGLPVFPHIEMPLDPLTAGYPILLDHCNAERKELMADVFRQAALSNITIQAVDPKGLIVGLVGGDPWKNPMTLRVEYLRTMAETTGGRAVVNNNDPDQEVPSILDESSSYYLLGVESPGVREDGAFHPIQVRVNRPHLEVRTRSGYYDPTEKQRKALSAVSAVPDLDAAIGSVVPKSDVPMDVSVAPFAMPDGKAALAIVLGVNHPVAEAQRGQARIEQIEMMASAFGPEGGKGYGAERQTLNLEWNATDAVAGRYEVFSRIPVPTGRYELRLGLKTGDARTASVYTSVEVPDFDGADLSLSGLVLGATPQLKSAPSAAFSDLMPIVPTARRTFRATDEVTAFLRVYQDNDKFSPATVTTKLTDATNQVLADLVETLEGTSNGSISTADFQIELPMPQLTAGEYLLTIEVAARDKTARRALRFRVQ